MPPPAGSRPARHVAASVALACGAALAVTAGATEVIISPREATTPQAIPQDHATYPGTTYPGFNSTEPDPAGPTPAAPPLAVQQADPDPVTSPAPDAGRSAVVRQPPQSIPVPPAPKQVAEPTAVPRRETQREASSQPRITKKPHVARTSPPTRRPSSNPPAGRGDRPSLGSTLNRATESLESKLGLR
ncbi:MAG: hypothetical protein ACRDS1_16255 [Pseudonocardiaceae bacterium]